MKSYFISSVIIISIFISITSVNSCKKAEDDPAEEQELITTLILSFNNSSNTQKFQFKDLDGTGGQAPLIDTIRLKANVNYTLNLSLLDESKSPSEDLTLEVKNESDAHIFIFSFSSISILKITPTDKDSKGQPVGLQNDAMTGAPFKGLMQVLLKHQADKSNPASTGETDIDAIFPLIIE